MRIRVHRVGATLAVGLVALFVSSPGPVEAGITVYNSGGYAEATVHRQFGPTDQLHSDCVNTPNCGASASRTYHEVFVFGANGSICGVVNHDPIYWTNDATATASVSSQVTITGDTMTLTSSGNVSSQNKAQMTVIPCGNVYIGDSSGHDVYLISFTVT